MKADNTAHLVAAAARRRQATLRRAGDAIDQLLATGAPVSIASVSHAARVSRSWLYAETPIRDRIHAARNDHAAATTPVSQRASDTSLRRRLELAHHRNRELTDEVRQLRGELARAHGLIRLRRAEPDNS